MAQKKTANNDRLLMGRNCVREALRLRPELIEEVYIVSGAKRDRGRFEEILDLASRNGVVVKELSADKLSSLVGSDSHQSIAARRSTRMYKEVDQFIDGLAPGPQLVLAIDAIQDPQNFGALLRAAECYDAAGVLWSKNRGAPLTPVVARASVGASELVELVRASNLVDAIKRFKEFGFWIVVCESRPEAQAHNKFEFPERCVIVVGAEGRGVQELLRKQADFYVGIELYGQIDSLNVSQASAVILDAYRRSLQLQA